MSKKKKVPASAERPAESQKAEKTAEQTQAAEMQYMLVADLPKGKQRLFYVANISAAAWPAVLMIFYLITASLVSLSSAPVIGITYLIATSIESVVIVIGDFVIAVVSLLKLSAIKRWKFIGIWIGLLWIIVLLILCFGLKIVNPYSI